MKKAEALNTFNQGLVMDINPLVTPNDSLCNALNATLITYNGNENALQCDMGNGRVETAYLPEGYVPVGTAQQGGIIYIVSYNPLIDKCQIGSFPSPERNVTISEINSTGVTVENSSFVTNGKVTNTLLKVKLLSTSGITKLNSGDKYVIYSTNGGITNNQTNISDVNTGIYKVDATPRYVTIHVVSIGEDGKITYLDDNLKWDSNLKYYIKEPSAGKTIEQDIDSYRSLVSSAYNIFNSKVSGELALLFELKTIDSFNVTWDAQVANIQDTTNDKQATIYFNLDWQSSHPTINPAYAILSQSSFPSETTVSSGSYADLRSVTGRLNDGTDDAIKVEVGTFKYNSNNDLGQYVWEYKVTPAMRFGELEYLSVQGTINFSEIGSGKIQLDEWRYFVQDNSFYLNWGLDAYPEINKKIDNVTFVFIPFQDVLSVSLEDNTALLGTYPNYIVSGKTSYSGNFQEVIDFDSSNRIKNGPLLKNYLYLVDTQIKYGNSDSWEIRHNYRWIYTTGQWNDKFFDESIKDFQTLDLSSVVELTTDNEIRDNIVSVEETIKPSLPKSVSETQPQYDMMGAKIVSVNFEGDRFETNNSNLEVDLSVAPKKYKELFKVSLQTSDSFSNSIDKVYISHDPFEIDSDAISALSPYVMSKVMENTIDTTNLSSAIQSIKLNSKIIDQTIDDKAIDSFGASIRSGQNTDKIRINVHGAVFSRVNADIFESDVQVGQVVRPILYSTDDYSGLGISGTSTPSLYSYFAIGQRDLGGGKPFAFKVGEISSSGSTLNEKESSKGEWDPTDTFSKNNYWDDTPPYTDYLNQWMLSSCSPFVIVHYSHYYSDHGTKSGETFITGKYGLWARTSKDHYVPLNIFSSSYSTLFTLTLKLLTQVYYVETEANSVRRCIVKYINRLKTFSENWNIDIKSQLTVGNPQKSVCLISRSSEGPIGEVSLQDLMNSSIVTSNLSLKKNLEYKYTSTTIDIDPITISHQFRVSTNDLYAYYENLKTAYIAAIYKLSTQLGEVEGPAKNSNQLYVYDVKGDRFLTLSNVSNSKYFITSGNITTQVDPEDSSTTRVLLGVSSSNTYSSSTELCSMLRMSGGALCIDEDQLLRSRITFTYYTQAGNGTYTSNSKVKFIG